MKLKCMALVVTAALLPFVGTGKSYWSGLFSRYGYSASFGLSSGRSVTGGKTFEYGDVSLEPEDSLFFSVEELPDEIGGYEVLGEYFPDGIEVTWTGRRFKVPAAGVVRYNAREGEFTTTRDDNPCGFRISISKKGKVTGSFRVYVAVSEKRLKSYTAKISGYLGESLSVTIKKAGVSTAASLD